MPDRNKRFRGKPKKVKIVSNNTDFSALNRRKK